MKKKLILIAIFAILIGVILIKNLTPQEQAGDDRPRQDSAQASLPAKPECEIPFAEKTARNITVSFQPKMKLEVKGVIFADLFGPLGGPGFDSAPKDPECLSKVLDHAMSAPLRAGAGWIGIVSAAWYRQVSPLPVIGTVPGLGGDETNYHSLTDETYYAALIGAAKQRGLKVVHTESLAMGLGLAPDQINALDVMKKDPKWWDEWFEQWKGWVVPRAARAEKYGVDMFVLYLFAEDTFRPDVYPDYDKRWGEIIREVRKVYSGKVAVNLINADERLTFADELDALLLTVFDGLYTSRGTIRDVKNPTMQELINLTEDFLFWPKKLFGEKLPIYYVLTVTSTDGQEFSEDPNARGKVDFGEQALYYEAFFRAIENETWIKGFFSERWDWFDQYKRPPEGSYFDQTGGGSPRNKPAEEVIKIWFSEI